MTSKAQTSLFALGMAAKKGMTLDEIEMHSRIITEEIESYRIKADENDRAALDFTMPMPISDTKNLSGNAALDRVQLRVPMAPAYEMMAESYSRRSRRALKLYMNCLASEKLEAADIIAEYGKAAAKCSDKFAELAKKK